MSNTTGHQNSASQQAQLIQVCKVGGWDMYPPNAWWMVDNMFSYVMPVIILQYALFVILSQTMCLLFYPLKQIKFVSYTLAGILMGPSFLGKYLQSQIAPNDLVFVRTNIAYIGMTYFVFIIGVKIDFGMISRMGKRAWAVGVVSLFCPLITMVLLWMILIGSRDPDSQSLLVFATIACSLSSTNTANLASALDELDLLTSDMGELSVSCALINDFIIGVFLALQASLRQNDPFHSIYLILSSCIILAFVVCVVRPLMLWIIERTPVGEPVQEGYIVGILLGVLGIRVILEATGGNGLQAPLLLGMIVPAGPPLGSALTQRVETIVSELLVPFYYMEVGTVLNLRKVDLHFGSSLARFIGFEAIILTGFLVKIAGTMWSALNTNMSLDDSLKLSLFMSIRGITDLIIHQFYKMMGMLSEAQAAALILSTIAETSMITPLIKSFCKSDMKTDELDTYFANSLQATSFGSELRILSCVHHEHDVPSIVCLLEASNRASAFPICAYVVHMIELIGESASSLTQHQRHRRRCAHNRCHQIMAAFKTCSTNLNLRVNVQPFTLTAPLKSMQEGICRLAQERNVPLVLIPFVKKGGDPRRNDAAFNSIVSRLQETAPCTVGVIVDKGTSRLGSNRWGDMVYHVGVFFIGGEDDREALAYASRMLGHPSVRVTLYHIEVGMERFVDSEERRLNIVAIEEFRSTNMNDPGAVFQRVEVEDWEQVLKAIRVTSDQHDFDLVMVGRRQGTSSRIAQEMFSWIENPELGMIGDMIASMNHVDRQMSLLVVQHAGQIDGGPGMTLLI